MLLGLWTLILWTVVVFIAGGLLLKPIWNYVLGLIMKNLK